MKITACNDDFLAAATWYAHALGIAGHDFELTIDYGDDMIGAAQILYYKGKAVITMNTTQDESDDEMELLAHEMVHLRQYVTGQMVDDLFNSLVIWEGKAHNACVDANSWAYWNAPWELEAFSRQRGLNYMRVVALQKERNECPAIHPLTTVTTKTQTKSNVLRNCFAVLHGLWLDWVSTSRKTRN